MSPLEPQQLWGVIAALGIGTLLIRASFIVGQGKREPSAWMQRCLRPVPAAVLSALVAPAILVRDDAGGIDVTHPRFWAGLVAALVAWRTRNAFATIGVGMGTLWLLQWWLS